MPKTRVKICGITNLEDARAAIASGCDALGFVFYRKSERYISPEQARKIIRQLPDTLIKIGVFVNSRESFIRKVAKMCRLKMLQFHGEESPEFCRRFRNYEVIKSFRIRGHIDRDRLSEYRVFAYHFDAYVEDKPGGTGEHFDWELIRHLCPLKKPIFLAGGLNKDNVAQAIRCIGPDWVDAASSLEFKPGKKDIKKVAAFIKAARKS